MSYEYLMSRYPFGDFHRQRVIKNDLRSKIMTELERKNYNKSYRLKKKEQGYVHRSFFIPAKLVPEIEKLVAAYKLKEILKG